ncbi:MAG: hypothetical protein AB1540_16175 [Bdellovibrionota bacterium]
MKGICSVFSVVFAFCLSQPAQADTTNYRITDGPGWDQMTAQEQAAVTNGQQVLRTNIAADRWEFTTFQAITPASGVNASPRRAAAIYWDAEGQTAPDYNGAFFTDVDYIFGQGTAAVVQRVTLSNGLQFTQYNQVIKNSHGGYILPTTITDPAAVAPTGFHNVTGEYVFDPLPSNSNGSLLIYHIYYYPLLSTIQQDPAVVQQILAGVQGGVQFGANVHDNYISTHNPTLAQLLHLANALH